VNEFVIPTDWTFKDRSVADGFDAHVREQLPWYELASGAVAHVARHYISEKGLVYDIGASTGNIGNLIADTLEARHADLVAIDDSAEMADLYRGPGNLVVTNAVEHLYEPCDVAIMFLVVMFIPVHQREQFLWRVYETIKPGGAMIVVDKADETCGYLATILRRLTLAGKVATGTSAEDIIAKELSLSGVQRPINVSMLPGEPEMFFKFGEFTGWLIER
jgi:tRNA (cmo5U34)-methyltransferase